MRRKPILALSALVAGVVFTASAHAGEFDNGGFAPISPVSPNVERSTDVYYFILAFAALIFLLVTVPIVYFAFRYRSRGRARAVEGPEIHGSNRLEIAWTILPIAILVAVAAFTFYKLPGITLEPAAGETPLRVRVEGRQFYWQYVYPNGVVAIDNLRVPVDRLVELDVTAPDGDVNHSFWVPPVGGKFDAIPGQTTRTAFRARETGRFSGQCAEFCGVQHAAMLASVVVLPQEEFDRWLAAAEGDDARLGRAEWEGVCQKCHRLEGEQLVGPNLTAATLGNEELVREIVRRGRGGMPAVGQGWTRDQMDALIAYLDTLAERED